MLKIYFDNSHYDKRFRTQLFPLLRPFIKGENYTDTERIKDYGVSEKDFDLVDDIDYADVTILTMSWDYYIKQDQLDLARSFISETLANKKMVWAVSLGDIGFKLPPYKNVIVFRASGFKSKLPQMHLGMPVFKKDPLWAYFKTKTISIPEFTLRPNIGFCGYANGSVSEMLKLSLKALIKIPINAIKSNPYEFDPVFVASYERFLLLKRIEKDTSIDTNFIYRSQYRAGANTDVLRHQTALEYFENMEHSQYVLCVRGAGNFSVRFYEALAMGRIPVFVNTDCLLPLSDVIDWKKHVVWVEDHEKYFLGQKILDFHEGLSKHEFENLCRSNRELWKEKLSLGGFFKLQKAEKNNS
ncbi:exostosin family protein [uncultured Algibacter sp.]|uniref:exostosin domain-containing protein n=1 Tax=uncultured Algibacter sp. TaxID=298659 RepID=UPI002626ECB5|nr:exostosin family protein [uncultured Algibacter sp.]